MGGLGRSTNHGLVKVDSYYNIIMEEDPCADLESQHCGVCLEPVDVQFIEMPCCKKTACSGCAERWEKECVKKKGPRPQYSCIYCRAAYRKALLLSSSSSLDQPLLTSRDGEDDLGRQCCTRTFHACHCICCAFTVAFFCVNSLVDLRHVHES